MEITLVSPYPFMHQLIILVNETFTIKRKLTQLHDRGAATENSLDGTLWRGVEQVHVCRLEGTSTEMAQGTVGLVDISARGAESGLGKCLWKTGAIAGGTQSGGSRGMGYQRCPRYVTSPHRTTLFSYFLPLSPCSRVLPRPPWANLITSSLSPPPLLLALIPVTCWVPF